MTFSIPKKPLSRRTVLRGMAAGGLVTIGLPRLEAMLNGNGTAYAQGAPLAKRFGVWFWGNGIIPNLWTPAVAGVGDAWALSPQLMPYANLKQNLTVLSGYEVKMDGEVHHVGPAGALTGMGHDADANYRDATIDHQIAELIGGASPFKSLQVGVSRATANGAGHTVNYASSSGANAPVMPEYDANALFQRLFMQTPTTDPGTPDKSFAFRKAVLDVVAQDATALSAKLGTADKARLEQHLEGVHEMQRRIDTLAMGGNGCDPSGIDTTAFPAAVEDLNGLCTPEQNSAMASLITYALSCELTNTFMFQHGRPAAHYNMENLGITVDIHDDISHVEEGDQPTMNSAMMYWFDQCRVFMEMLQNTPDGATNLLESSLIYGTSDVSFGFTHSKDEYPILLFGRAGGAIKGNQHHRVEADNISKVLLALVNLYGANKTEFGAEEGLVTSGIPEILAV
ncbi:MAG TPA: DUF1552 domain-containing protein [Polyangiaceae bacterium]|nr:DUF1552 domain-containing protein [Polyangiaceae bacterium]